MKCIVLACATAGLLTASLSPVGAQVTIDVSKITCEQWLLHKIADYDNLAIWLSGYFNGKRSNTTIDFHASKDAIGRAKDACIKALKEPVLLVLERELGDAR